MAAVKEIVSRLKTTGARRTASVCSGAYLLAMAGRLVGRRATTYWASTGDFGHRYPNVKLDADRIFIRDGDIGTSAGISAGIALALALIEDDLGSEVAQQLVVPRRRSGGQARFSAFLELGGQTGRGSTRHPLASNSWRHELAHLPQADPDPLALRTKAREGRIYRHLTP